MKSFNYIVEKCADTGLYVGYVPGFPGAHSQADTLEELRDNMKEVIELLLIDGDPKLEAEFVGTETVKVA
ncbi:MAG TPA: type II toxin-antitoxin system HicB family antitoxin [Pyrinomonadaceae bacterium]